MGQQKQFYESARGQEAHKIGYVERSSSTGVGCVGLLRFLVGPYSKKQFYESAKGQEAYKNTRAPRGSNIYIYIYE